MEGGQLTKFEEGSGRLPHFSNADSGYWWIELGGQYDDIIRDGEVIRDELLKCVYGVWDHLKNVGDHGVENLDLDWVGIVPGYRESRRIEGDYLLNENDVLENRIFPDAVAYGGWQMDEHVRGGIRDLDKIPSRILNFNGCYTIPWRCYYAKDLENVMLAGRDQYFQDGIRFHKSYGNLFCWRTGGRYGGSHGGKIQMYSQRDWRTYHGVTATTSAG